MASALTKSASLLSAAALRSAESQLFKDLAVFAHALVSPAGEGFVVAS